MVAVAAQNATVAALPPAKNVIAVLNAVSVVKATNHLNLDS